MIDVNNLSVSYYDKKVLNNINFKFDKPSIIGIIGPNGAGKSTLIKAILNLIPKDSGKITYSSSDMKIGYLPQRNNVDWDFPLSVLDVVEMGLYPEIGVGKRIKKEHHEKALVALGSVGMEDYKKTQISQLSGGQQQRVFMARALVQNPDILFLDEPFVGIDTETEALIMDILRNLKEEGKLIFIVHHDLSKVASYFDDVIMVNRALIAKGHVEEVFNQDNLNKMYFREMEVR